MYTLILTASPRPEGNTNSLVKVFAEELQRQGEGAPDSRGTEGAGDGQVQVKTINLYDLDIKPCTACRSCQKDRNNPACVIDDGLRAVFPEIMKAELIVLASPVYSWYCTPPMKALLDRCVYAMNKYYDEPGPSIWQGKEVALITTCGYPPEKGADLLEEGLRRYCRHSRLKYRGMLVERHMGYDIPFMDDAKADRARNFAKELLAGAGPAK